MHKQVQHVHGSSSLAIALQALRQFQFRVGADNFCVVHVSLVPVLGVVGEQKTKPTQHSVAVLRSLGLNPTLLACRSTDPIEPAVREKLVRADAFLPRRFVIHSAPRILD